MSTVVLFLIVLVILVVVHELGHFFVARWCGIRVEEFGVGYPPRARKLFIWKGTLFTLNWLPFGGFVKIFGETGEEVQASDSFAHQKLWKRLAVIVAGVVANILLAVVLYTASFNIGFIGSVSDFPQAQLATPESIVITDVMNGSPAERAGLRSGDAIKELRVGTSASEIKNNTDVTEFVHAHSAQEISVVFTRGSHEQTVAIMPTVLSDGTPALGVGIAKLARLKLPFFQALKYGSLYTVSVFNETIVSFGKLLGSIFKKDHSLLSQVSGPVGIAQFAGNAYALGIGSLLSFMGFISINLAVINLLPIPALDGGRFIIELFSRNGKSKLPERALGVVQRLSFVLLLVLILYVTYHDIVRLFT